MLANVPFEELTVQQAKQRVSGWLYEQADGVVQSGPFRGMRIPLERSWDHCLAPYVLGSYEQELHGTIEYEIARLSALPKVKIVNIGCAEGYYAVGMACRIPNSLVWVIDTPEAVNVAGLAAAFNGVQLMVGGAFEVVFSETDLIISDCEGAEIDYLDKERFPDLWHATIIVECHDVPGQPTSQMLFDRFCESHYVMQVLSGPRNPANFNLLSSVHTTVQWLMMDEGRPMAMRWLVMRPKIKC